jgi:GAF domain-containing protein
MSEPTSTELFRRLEELNEVGISLSKVKDTNRLLEAIVVAAKKITNADGGTLYRVDADKKLVHFEILRTDSLNIAMGGTTGVEVPFYPVRLFDDDGRPNNSMVVAYSVLRDETVNIADAYAAKGFDFTGTKSFDGKTGYRSESFLTVPMKNHEDEVIGVLQLINAKDRQTGAIVPFSEADQRLA